MTISLCMTDDILFTFVFLTFLLSYILYYSYIFITIILSLLYNDYLHHARTMIIYIMHGQ